MMGKAWCSCLDRAAHCGDAACLSFSAIAGDSYQPALSEDREGQEDAAQIKDKSK
jgi:hypothetical protein